LHRIFDFMSRCRVSIHDLSHVGRPVRFNMPFELGIACALSRFRKPHDFILLECKRHRLDQTLSDIRGWAPFIYQGRIRTLENCIVDSLTRRDDNPDPDKIHRVSRRRRAEPSSSFTSNHDLGAHGNSNKCEFGRMSVIPDIQ